MYLEFKWVEKRECVLRVKYQLSTTKEIKWQKTMNDEIDVIEKNNT